MLKTIIFRYLGTFVQFILLAVIARSLSPDDYGLYILCLGVVFSYYYIVGMGASEAAVPELSRNSTTEVNIESASIASNVIMGSLISALLLIFTSLLLPYIDISGDNTEVAINFILLFIATNGIIFNISQLLLALGHSTIGSFFFYPAINLTLLFSTVPAALIIKNIEFRTITQFSLAGSAFTAAISIFIALKIIGINRIRFNFNVLLRLIKSGIGMTAVRILHVVSFWIPTMIAGFSLTTIEAGQIGTAGRLSIAVSAVIAAIRFVIRPTITRCIQNHDYNGLRDLAGAAAFFTCTLALISLGLSILLGQEIIPLFFGNNLDAVPNLLNILLISVIFEAIFGPVDEILKMAGFQREVAISYICSVTCLIITCLIVAKFGLTYLAWCQVGYVAILFTTLNLLVKYKLGFFVTPQFKNLNLLKSVK